MDAARKIGFQPFAASLSKLGKAKGVQPAPNKAPEKPSVSQPSESVSITADLGTVDYRTFEPVTELKPTPQQNPKSSSPSAETISVPTSTFTQSGPAGTTIEMNERGTLVMFDESPIGATNFSVNLDPEKVDYMQSAAKETSHAALLAVDTGTSAKMVATGTASAWMSTAGSLGGGLLVLYGVHKAIGGESTEARMAGASEAGWGGQSLLASSGIQGAAASVAEGLGVVGGVIQSGLGVKKAAEGLGLLKNKDGEKVKSKEKVGVGAVETLAGTSWILASVGVATGVTLPAFIGLTIGAKAYQHRDKLANVARKGVSGLKSMAQQGSDAFSNARQKLTNRSAQTFS